MSDQVLRDFVASRLRKALDDKKWNQADLVRASGVAAMMISRILRAKSEPSILTLERIAKAVEVPIDDFFPPHNEKIPE